VFITFYFPPFRCAADSTRLEYVYLTQNSSVIIDPTRPDGLQDVGEVVGNQRFIITGAGTPNCTFNVYINGKLRYRARDESVVVAGEHWKPGETDHAYDFYLSSDGRYLLVRRDIAIDLAVCELYERSKGIDMRPVRPGGFRFDEAVVRHFAAREHLDPVKLGSVTREIAFDRWAGRNGRFVFDEVTALYWIEEGAGKTDVAREWVAEFDPRTMRFRLIARNGH
jgi:hypothetical protein